LENKDDPPDVNTTTSPESHIEKVSREFRAAEPAISDRFAYIMRLWTIAWAFVVAITFQVSTSELLKSLSTADARREAIIAAVPSMLKQADTAIQSNMGGDFVDTMLQRLAVDFPDQKSLFKQVSGSTDSKDEMIEELSAVVAHEPDHDRIVQRYTEIIDAALSQNMKSAVTTTNEALDKLDTFGINVWKDDGYYGTSFGNIEWRRILGVLLTAILLSFGAPFWFEQLKNVARLRDAVTTNKGTAPSA